MNPFRNPYISGLFGFAATAAFLLPPIIEERVIGVAMEQDNETAQGISY